MRRLFAALVAVSLMLPVLAVGPVSANEGNCSQGKGWRDFAGMENSSSTPSQNRSGAGASIQISRDGFDICNNYGIDYSSISAWVSISPRDAGDTNRIIQVGITECANGNILGGPVCQGENNPHFFWAWGGCGLQIPFAQDMGPADGLLHDYALWLDNAGYWHFVVDGAPIGSEKHKRLPNVYINCWSGLTRRASWMAERADPGDSSGNVTDKTRVYNAAYGVYNQGWFNPLWNANSSCHYYTTQNKCDLLSDNDLDFWTVQ